MRATSLSRQSPFVYFWLGILTGVLLIVASMMIQQIARNGSVSLFRDATVDDRYYDDTSRTYDSGSADFGPQSVTEYDTQSFGPQSVEGVDEFGPQSLDGVDEFGPQSYTR